MAGVNCFFTYPPAVNPADAFNREGRINTGAAGPGPALVKFAGLLSATSDKAMALLKSCENAPLVIWDLPSEAVKPNSSGVFFLAARFVSVGLKSGITISLEM